MFNVGPFEMLVLAAVALIVFGPDKLPQLAKDAARMLRTLRDLAQGARSQLSDELGPEFADIDLRSLNPRTAIRNALLGDEELPNLNPREVISRALRGEDDAPPPGRSQPGRTSSGRPPSGQASSGQASSGQAQAGQPQPAGSAAEQNGHPAPSPTTGEPVAHDQDPTMATHYPDPTSVPYDPDAT